MSVSTSYTSQTRSWWDDQVSCGICWQTWIRASVNTWTVWAAMWQQWIQGYMMSQWSLAGLSSWGGGSIPSMSSLSGNSWHTPAPRGWKVMEQKEPGAHCTRMWSNNGTQQQWGYLGWACGALCSLPAKCMPGSSQTTAQHSLQHFYGVSSAQCEPARICEENTAPSAILPILVFSGKHQPSGARSYSWSVGLPATSRSLFHSVWAETCTQMEYRRSFSRAAVPACTEKSVGVWSRFWNRLDWIEEQF